jgi:hypothetical protein
MKKRLNLPSTSYAFSAVKPNFRLTPALEAISRRSFLHLIASCLTGCGGGAAGYGWDSEESSIHEISNNAPILKYQFDTLTLNANFPSRDGCGLVQLNEKLYVIGGWSRTGVFPRVTANDVWRSDGALSEWVLLKENTWDLNYKPEDGWTGRHSAGYLAYKNKLWIIGGDFISDEYQSDIWNSTDGSSWSLVSNSYPLEKRVLFHCFLLNGYIWILGGQRVDDEIIDYESSYYRDAWRSLDGNSWERIIPRVDKGDLFPSGLIQGSAKMDGYVYIIGGGYYNTRFGKRQFRNDVYKSKDGIEWEQVTGEAPWEPRIYASVASYAGRLWIIGGAKPDISDPGGTEVSDVWYSHNGRDWTQLLGEPWSSRHAASVCVFQDRLIVLAGTINPVSGRKTVNDVYELKVEI